MSDLLAESGSCLTIIHPVFPGLGPNPTGSLLELQHMEIKLKTTLESNMKRPTFLPDSSQAFQLLHVNCLVHWSFTICHLFSGITPRKFITQLKKDKERGGEG